MASYQPSTIELSYVVTSPVIKNNVLWDLLIKQRCPVLFVGEGNFSFTVAFAALREHESPRKSRSSSCGTWNGIIATRYEPVGESGKEKVGSKFVNCKPAPILSDVKTLCISEIKKNRSKLQRSDMDSNILKINALLDDSWMVRYGVDACDIPQDLLPVIPPQPVPPALSSPSSPLHPPPEVIWFQCPWNDKGSVGKLIEGFLLNEYCCTS